MYSPAGQSWHALPPITAKNNPLSHRKHAVARSTVLNSPLGHSRHALAPTVEKVPAVQDKQLMVLPFTRLCRNPPRQMQPSNPDPGSESESVGQAVHSLAPSPL